MNAAKEHPLIRDIALVLVAKAILLTCLFCWFFGPASRLDVTPQRLEHHLLPPAPTSPPAAFKEAP